MRLWVKKDSSGKGRYFYGYPHTHTPPVFWTTLHRDNGIVVVKESKSTTTKKKEAHARSSLGIFFFCLRRGGSLVVDAKSVLASERGSAFFLRAWNWNSKNFLFCNERRNLTNSSHRKVAETTRRAHASTSKSASGQTTSSIESKRTFERTRRNGSSRLFDAVEALLYQFWRLKKASWRVD